MVVTYRLAGVDGEATEEVVASLPDSDAATDLNPELKFGIARYIAEVRPCPLERPEIMNVGVGPQTNYNLPFFTHFKKKWFLGLYFSSRLVLYRLQEGGLPLLLSLAQAPPRVRGVGSSEDEMELGSKESTLLYPGSASTAVGKGMVGGLEVFALAVRLLRRVCMLSANRADLLALKVTTAL